MVAAATPAAPPPKGSEARMQHLRNLMATKVAKWWRDAYGTPLSPAKLAFVEEQIAELLTQGAPTDKQLQRVLQMVKERFGDGRAPAASRRSTEAASRRSTQATPVSGTADSCRSSAVGRGDSACGSGAIAASQLGSGALSTRHQKRQALIQKDMWAMLTKKDMQEHEKEEERRKQRMRDRRAAQRDALDEQVEQRRAHKAHEREEMERASREEAERVAVWKRETAEEEVRRKQAHAKEKQARDAQLRDLDQRKRMDEERKRQEEQNAADKIRHELEAEQLATLRKKEKAKADINRYMEFNAEQRAMKDALKDKEMEEEKRMHLEHIAKLEKQERDREDALRKLYDRQSKQVAMGSKIAAGLAEKAAEDERRAEREQAKIMKKLEDEEQRRAERIAREKDGIKVYLAQQIRQKEDKRRAEKQELVCLRDQLMADVRAAENDEKQKNKQKRLKDVANREQITEQIRTKLDKVPDDFMSHREKALNQKLLRRLSNVPEDA